MKLSRIVFCGLILAMMISTVDGSRMSSYYMTT